MGNTKPCAEHQYYEAITPPKMTGTLAKQQVGGHGIGLIRAYMVELGYETRRKK